MSSENNDTITFFPIWMSFLSFSYLVALVWNFNTIVNIFLISKKENSTTKYGLVTTGEFYQTFKELSIQIFSKFKKKEKTKIINN